MGTLPTGADIVLGQTPSILAEYGAPALDLHMRQSVARKIAYPSGYMGGKHNLGLSALKNLPYQLADPIAIIENPQSNSRGLASKIVLTEWNDLDGKPVIIPIHLNAQGAIDVQNDVASAFGADYIQRIIGNNGENVLYTKNNEDIYQLLSKGVQCPRRWLMMSSLETVYPQPGRMSTYSRAIAVKHRIRPGRGLGLPLRQAREFRRRSSEGLRPLVGVPGHQERVLPRRGQRGPTGGRAHHRPAGAAHPQDRLHLHGGKGYSRRGGGRHSEHGAARGSCPMTE